MTNQTLQDFELPSFEEWQQLASKSLKDKTLAELAHKTASALQIEPLYVKRPTALSSSITEPMQRWDNRLAVLGNNATKQNANVLEGLRGGVDSLQITIDSPETASSTHLADLQTVLADVQLNIIPISLFSGSQFVNAAKELTSIFSKQGVNLETAVASINADPIGTMVAAGGLSTSLDSLLQDMASLVKTQNQTTPMVKTVCVNTSYYHNAGATIEQELVSAIATGTIYLQHLLDSGIEPQTANNSIVFQTSCDADTLANVVKLRALKQLWQHVTHHMGVSEPNMHLVVETSKRMLSNLSPWVNHLRNVSAATAAAMGGANSIVIHPHNHINGHFIDEQVELSARVARNVPIILSEESSMTLVHDPMAGSYAVETMCSKLLESTWLALQTLEQEGGLIQALNSGQWQQAIALSKSERQIRLKTEQDIQVGVNRFTGATTSNRKVDTNSVSTTGDRTNNASNDVNNSGHNDQFIEKVTALTIARDSEPFEMDATINAEGKS